MVLNFKTMVVLEKSLNLVGHGVGAQPCLRDTHIVDASRDPHVADILAGQDRMLDHLEERSLETRREAVVNFRGRSSKSIPARHDILGSKNAG